MLKQKLVLSACDTNVHIPTRGIPRKWQGPLRRSGSVRRNQRFMRRRSTACTGRSDKLRSACIEADGENIKTRGKSTNEHRTFYLVITRLDVKSGPKVRSTALRHNDAASITQELNPRANRRDSLSLGHASEDMAMTSLRIYRG